jgi:hypothetical protein
MTLSRRVQPPFELKARKSAAGAPTRTVSPEALEIPNMVVRNPLKMMSRCKLKMRHQRLVRTKSDKYFLSFSGEDSGMPICEQVDPKVFHV